MTHDEWDAVVKKLKDEPFDFGPAPFCGPFHPQDVDEMKRLDMNCPYCGRKVRSHNEPRADR